MLRQVWSERGVACLCRLDWGNRRQEGGGAGDGNAAD
jgi:hypothetical protein